MIAVSVVIPSRDRPERLRECIEQLQLVSPEVEIIVVADIGDKKTAAVAESLKCKLVISDRPDGPVHCWNIGAAAASGEALVLGADDLKFHEGWMEAALNGLAKLNFVGLVAFNDLSPQAGKLATHYMISKNYAANDWGGVLAIPSYYQHFVDTEATVRSQRDKCFYYAEDSIVEHKHWLWKKADNDEVYQRGQESYAEGEETYNQRLQLGFPNDYKRYFYRTDARPDNWGRIAVGTRCYKNSSGSFLNSWTFLLASGLQPGDSVLAAPVGKPAHLAANDLARAFLNTKCDSILFVDDDMEFSPDSLRRLRSNEATWDYDMVMGFCTHKTVPPHAVVLRKLEPPGPPMILKGEHYGALRDVPDNSVIDVDAVGLAFTLIKRHVLEEKINEFGIMYTPFFEWGKFAEGEDVVFSRWARENGFKLAVDTNVKIDHLGEYAFGWRQFHDYLEQEQRIKI